MTASAYIPYIGSNTTMPILPGATGTGASQPYDGYQPPNTNFAPSPPNPTNTYNPHNGGVRVSTDGGLAAVTIILAVVCLL